MKLEEMGSFVSGRIKSYCNIHPSIHPSLPWLRGCHSLTSLMTLTGCVSPDVQRCTYAPYGHVNKVVTAALGGGQLALTTAAFLRCRAGRRLRPEITDSIAQANVTVVDVDTPTAWFTALLLTAHLSASLDHADGLMRDERHPCHDAHELAQTQHGGHSSVLNEFKGPF